jgi:hypothetical protein
VPFREYGAGAKNPVRMGQRRRPEEERAERTDHHDDQPNERRGLCGAMGARTATSGHRKNTRHSNRKPGDESTARFVVALQQEAQGEHRAEGQNQSRDTAEEAPAGRCGEG